MSLIHAPSLKPLQYGGALASVTLLTGCVCLVMLYRQGVDALKQEVRHSLVQMAKTVATLVDGDLHETFTDPRQEETSDYQQAVEPLRKVLHAHPEIRFLYTMAFRHQRPHFILDASLPGDADGDGIEDHSPIMQPFETPVPALLAALTNGSIQADSEPIRDRWGTYLSGYAPLYDSQGRHVGIVGVDLRLNDYVARLAALRRALIVGVISAFLLSLLVGIGAWWMESRARQSDQYRLSTVKALRQSEAHYKMLFEQMVSGFALHEMIYDAQGQPVDYRFLAVNSAFERLTGLQAANLIGRTVRQVLPQTEQTWIDTYSRVTATGVPVQFENFHHGLGRHYQVTAYRPTPGQFACIFTDVTEQKRMAEERLKTQEQLQHVQKLEGLGLLAGGIAHDFNNLLMAILGNADLAIEDAPPRSPIRTSLDQIKQISLRAADLCKQMLAYSGKGKFLVAPLNLSQLVKDMTKLLEISISKKAVLRYNLAPDLPAVEADATQMHQVILNLVINASEAIGERSGVIMLTTGTLNCDEQCQREMYLNTPLESGPYVYVEVQDTGCGMDKDTQSRLFDPFFTTKFTGRGLGLAAVMGIVRGHKGAIKVCSEPGNGSTFTVLLPASGEVAAVEKGLLPPTSWKGSGTILLVDDEETVRAVTRRMLERSGYTVITASDGREAVMLFKQQSDKLACVLMDLTMPHMDGDMAFREMFRFRSDIPVILSSGYSPQDIEQRFAGKGLAGFLQKPYELATLIGMIRKATSQS
jgi:PAS domain S-box-containing protein